MLRKTGVRIAFYIMLLTLASKVLGFVREMAIANRFGASLESDALFVALMIPNILFAAVAQAIGTTFIPVYLRTEKNNRLYFTNNLLTIIGMLSLTLTLVTIILAPYLVKLFAYGFTTEGQNLTTNLTRILLLMMLFLAFIFIAVAKLQSNDNFLIPAAIGIPFNLTAIVYLTVIGSGYGITGYAWILVNAYFFQALFLFPSLLKLGWRYKYIIDLKEIGVQRVMRLSLPVIIGTSVAQVNIVVDRMLASGLAEGSISALHYASMVNLLSYGIVALAIISFIYPKLSGYAVEGNIEELALLTLTGIKVLIIILLPIIIGGIILADPLIGLLFEHGDFDEADRAMTAYAFAFYSLGLLGMGIRELLNRVYYSLQDTKTPMKNGVLALSLNIVLNLILVRYLDHGGLALATSISLSFASILLYRGLTKKLAGIGKRELLVTFSKALIASLLMGIVVNSFYYYRAIEAGSSLLQLLWLLIAVLIGFIVYLLASLLVRQALLVQFFRKMLRKDKNN